MLAPPCTCPLPQVFETSETCNTCGRSVPDRITASTRRLALHIAEVALGYRRIGDCTGRKAKEPTT